MDASLQALCGALKKVFIQLKPQQNALSFVIMTGKSQQGKTTLLQQSQLTQIHVPAERSAEIYHNEHGVIVELSESWLSQSKHLLEYTLKHLNQCHRKIRISGLILCVNVQTFLTNNPGEITANCKEHAHVINRFGRSLGYPVEAILMLTQADLLAGFCDFFHYEHPSELLKPFGFSIEPKIQAATWTDTLKIQFEQFIDAVGEQIIQKIHPARSSIKRTLIREFPLQLAGLGPAIQHLLHAITPAPVQLNALYFTSAQQGGLSWDRVGNKIKQEYALDLHENVQQSMNYRAYFINGALHDFQAQTKRQPQITAQWPVHLIAGLSVLVCLWIAQEYRQANSMLNQAQHELIAYDKFTDIQQKTRTSAIHLVNAESSLENMSIHTKSMSSIKSLQIQLQAQTTKQWTQHLVPQIKQELEGILDNNQALPAERYQALKIYLMLHDPKHFSAKELLKWLHQHPEKHADYPNSKLLRHLLPAKMQSIPINLQKVTDTRNYLNALPVNYLYYTLAKTSFTKQEIPLSIKGFMLARQTVPSYFTQAGFQSTRAALTTITQQLQAENWVLDRLDLNGLSALIEQSYCADYANWWQYFITHSAPIHANTYDLVKNLLQELHTTHALDTILQLIQKNTAPIPGPNQSLFNQKIAGNFTAVNLISQSSVRQLDQSLAEAIKFVTTLSMVNDHGETAFNLTKARFQGDRLHNPLRALYKQTDSLAQPVAGWVESIANDTWTLLINESRTYINHAWQNQVFPIYESSIAQRYPFADNADQEISLSEFDRFFAPHGLLNNFLNQYLKPFLNMSNAQWELKQVNNHVLPIDESMQNELIRANVITHMFFPHGKEQANIQFSLQKLTLDPVVSRLQFSIGEQQLSDTQGTDSYTHFSWPAPNATLKLETIEGHHYDLEETGPWALFKLLQNVNVLVDEDNSANIHILFEVNGNTGRYVLKTQNEVNPFIPGILKGFTLPPMI